MRLAAIPSVDRLLRSVEAQPLIAKHGRTRVTEALRHVLGELRATLLETGGADGPTESTIVDRVRGWLESAAAAPLTPVFNLTGTIIHTNLGRAPLPEQAIAAMAAAAREPVNLEFDLETGRRGDRDDHLASLLCRLTGAEAATVVNNNAAAVLLVLNTLALRKEVPTSRGELIEIGGSFRMPEIMARAGCRLVEVGTTNRVHLDDYANAIGPRTGAVMKVHSSNYAIVGFTSTVPEPDLATLCRARGVPFVVDLGSGTLTNLEAFGVAHEPTPRDSLRHGADLVTFSGDKLLGGPQAGVIVGRRDLIARLKRNPLKRALRVDKTTVAGLAAVLQIYLEPEHLAERIPIFRLLARPVSEIRGAAERLAPQVADAVAAVAQVTVTDCGSQIGSGALPVEEIASTGLRVAPHAGRRPGTVLNELAAALRSLPVPVLGRVNDDAIVLDLRCLQDEDAFVAQLPELRTRLAKSAPTIEPSTQA